MHDAAECLNSLRSPTQGIGEHQRVNDAPARGTPSAIGKLAGFGADADAYSEVSRA